MCVCVSVCVCGCGSRAKSAASGCLKLRLIASYQSNDKPVNEEAISFSPSRLLLALQSGEDLRED